MALGATAGALAEQLRSSFGIHQSYYQEWTTAKSEYQKSPYSEVGKVCSFRFTSAFFLRLLFAKKNYEKMFRY